MKLPSWHTGRCAVVGDAAYCPSPLRGVGTSLAILGAYVLAGEIIKHPDDHHAALCAYEEKLRLYVEQKQKLPPGVPSIASPRSALGVAIFRWVVWVMGIVVSSGVTKWFSSSKSEGEDTLSTAKYEFD